MKTLDEVIAQYEFCLSIGESACCICKFRDNDGVCRMRENALHYLIDYKLKRARVMEQAQACDDSERRLQEEITRYQEAVKACEAAENKYHMIAERTSQNCASTSQNIVCPNCGLRMEI